MKNETVEKKKGLFWFAFFVVVTLITTKCVLNLVDAQTLNGAFETKTYTADNISSLTASLEAQLKTENAKLHTAYGMDMTILPTYQVYASEDGASALVVYTVKFNGRTYPIYGYSQSHYFNGLNSLLEHRNSLIKTGAYTWDTNYIPEEDEIVPTPTQIPTHTSDGTPIVNETDDTDEVIERGGGEEE